MKRIIGGLAAGIVTLAVVQGGSELLAGSGRMLPIVAAGYFLSALAGGYLAARVSRRTWAGWAIALLVLAGAIWSLLQSSHPLWMQIASVVAPLLGGALAVRQAGVKHEATPVGDGR